MEKTLSREVLPAAPWCAGQYGAGGRREEGRTTGSVADYYKLPTDLGGDTASVWVAHRCYTWREDAHGRWDHCWSRWRSSRGWRDGELILTPAAWRWFELRWAATVQRCTGRSSVPLVAVVVLGLRERSSRDLREESKLRQWIRESSHPDPSPSRAPRSELAA